MPELQPYTVKISQLPPETVEAADGDDAVRKVGELIRTRPNLAVLHDDEPVVIKAPDGSVSMRDGTVGGFRAVG